MSGPISSQTITATDTVPEVFEYDLTISFKLNSLEELDYPELESMLRHVLRDWREGRYPFNAEMIQVGLDQSLKHAAYLQIERQCQQEFGREMVVSHGGRGKTAKWYLEAQKRFANCQRPWVNSEPEVKIT